MKTEYDLSKLRWRTNPYVSGPSPMHLTTQPFGAKQGVLDNSDVASLNFDGSELSIVVAREVLPDGRVHALRILFKDARQFRYLDEADLARYWTSEHFHRGYHVLEVQSGGWRDEESQSRGYELRAKEWLVVTGNGCVSIFSLLPPEIEQFMLERVE